MSAPFNEAVKELITKARIVSFTTWRSTHPAAAISRFQTADDEGRYLTDADFQAIQDLALDSSEFVPVARMLRDRASEIVDEAKAGVLAAFPDITQVGGGLYPPQRAEACWRDFWHFLRCITYAIAGDHTDYTSEQGLHYMKLLYQELQVPLEAMVKGLEELKTASLKRCHASQQERLAPYFDHLITQLSRYRA